METKECKILKTPDNAFVIMDAYPSGSGATANIYYGFRKQIKQYRDEDVEVAVKEFYYSGYSRKTRNGIIHLYKSENDPSNQFIQILYRTFKDEAKRIVGVNHPNIVKVYNFINDRNEEEDCGTGYLVMERIQGETLEDYISEKGSFSSLSKVWGYFKKICEAIEVVHKNDIIHRDLAPQNIMIEFDNNTKEIKCFRIIDFGNSKIATKSKTTYIRGCSNGFASPEMYNDKIETTKLVDIYSLGAILYYILTKKCPCEPNCENVLDSNKLEYLNPSVAAVIKKAMAKDPTNRYQNMEEFILACEMAVKSEQMIFDSHAIINIMPNITLEDLYNIGELTITLPLDEETLESEIVKESHISWKGYLKDKSMQKDFQVGDLIFKRLTIKAILCGSNYKFVVL